MIAALDASRVTRYPRHCWACQVQLGPDWWKPVETKPDGRQVLGRGLFCKFCAEMVAHNRAEIAAGRRQPITPCGYLP